jgi:cbb3-type cytochrome c oxidase subunit III
VAGGPGLDRWIADHFRSPASIVATSQMPPVAATEKEIDLLTLYVLSLRRRDLPGAYVPRDRMRAARLGEREFAADGSTLYSAFCSGCHGADGKGKHASGGTTFPAIANPDFLGLASDDFLAVTIRKGRPGRRMPGWAKDGGLREDEISRIVAHLRKLGGPETPRSRERKQETGNAAAGRAIYAANCAGCHGEKGEGAKGPALNNRTLLETASDAFLFETIGRGRRGTAMAGFETPSPTRRALAPDEIGSAVAYIRTWQGGNK